MDLQPVVHSGQLAAELLHHAVGLLIVGALLGALVKAALTAARVPAP